MHDGHLSLLGSFFRNKWVRVVVVLNIVIIILIIALCIDKARKTAVLSFDISPIDVSIEVNGHSGYENSGQVYYFVPGTYEVRLSHDGLDAKTFVVELESSHNTTITTFLSKEDDFYYYTLRDNLSSFEKLAQIASVENNQTLDHDTSAEDFIIDYQRNYRLYMTQLPVTYTDYDDKGKLVRYVAVRGSDSCDVTLCLEAVVFDENDKQIAKSLLEGKGFNMKDFEIKYEVR